MLIIKKLSNDELKKGPLYLPTDNIETTFKIEGDYGEVVHCVAYYVPNTLKDIAEIYLENNRLKEEIMRLEKQCELAEIKEFNSRRELREIRDKKDIFSFNRAAVVLVFISIASLLTYLLFR